MNWSTLTGGTPAWKIVFWATALIPITNLIMVVFTILYQKSLYRKTRRSRYDESWKPRCSIIIPCKGFVKNLKENLDAFLKIDYADYEVLYVVESQKDPAVDVIREIVAESDKAQLVIAGLSIACAQKNWNLLAAVKKTSNSEVFVFADSDIEPRGHWLKELILPLSTQKITVTTGFRWLFTNTGSLGELMHFYSNAFIYALFSFASYVGGVGLWGGSMAIRKKDFEDMHVEKRWSETVVDDSSLAQLVIKCGRKAILVPTSITHTDDAIKQVKPSMQWLWRQAMFLKYYQRWLWLFIGAPVCGLAVFANMWLPFAIGISLLSDKGFFEIGGGTSLVFILGETLAASMYQILGPMGKKFRFLIMAPLIRFLHAIAYFQTHFNKTVVWSGIRYRMSFNGKVASIDRPM